MALEFYKMMQAQDAGQKIAKIELVDLSPEDTKKADAVMDGPGGQKDALPLKPAKKLKITVEKKSADGSSTSSSETFIAEKDGKFVIPVAGLGKVADPSRPSLLDHTVHGLLVAPPAVSQTRSTCPFGD